MSLRVGMDLTSVEDVRASMRAHGDRYLKRVYSPREIEECAGQATRLAGRFAAKEAVMKVLAPPPGAAIPWTAIGVHASAVPGTADVDLDGAARAQADRMGVDSVSVSLTGHPGHAAALAIGRVAR